MDTRYWGPSGWGLLHLIVANPNLSKSDIHAFLKELPYVLPCKWCRRNLTLHYEDLPFEGVDDFEKWMWQIHNKVNGILHKKQPSPTLAATRKTYSERFAYGCTKTEFPGWEFLFSIVKDHPIQKGNQLIPNAPPVETLETDLEKNKWNALTPAERFAHWQAFWNALPAVFPYAEWTTVWKECIDDKESSDPTSWKTSGDAMKGLWKLRCKFEEKLSLLNKTSYKALCNDLTFYRSGCASRANKSQTCRRLRQTRKPQR